MLASLEKWWKKVSSGGLLAGLKIFAGYIRSFLACIVQMILKFICEVTKRTINLFYLYFSLTFLLKQKQVKCTGQVSPTERGEMSLL
jgi:hypothetical protein